MRPKSTTPAVGSIVHYYRGCNNDGGSLSIASNLLTPDASGQGAAEGHFLISSTVLYV